jgi:Skp family chaperone for outer membrane proteins
METELAMRRVLTALVILTGSLSWTAYGQSAAALNVVTVDMAKVYGSYSKAEQSKEQFQLAVEKAQEEMRGMLDEGVKMAKDLQETQEKMDNPALSESARAKFQKQVEEKSEAVRKKEMEVNSFRQQTDRELADRREAFVTKHVEEIRAVVKSIATKRNASLALNTAGLEVLHAAPALDVTDEVITILNGKK